MGKNNFINKSSDLVKMNFTIVRYLLLGIFCVIIIASGYIYYLISTQNPPPVYIFDKKKVTAVFTLNLPEISNEQVMRWASQAVSDIYSFNFAQNLDEHFDRVSQYFTPDGYSQYMVSLEESGLLSETKSKDIAYYANSCDVVNVSNQLQVIIDGIPNTVWYIDIPLLIKVESSGPTLLQHYIVSAVVKGGNDVRSDKSIGLIGVVMHLAGKGVCSISKLSL